MKLTSTAIFLATLFTQTVLAQSTGRVFVTNERSNTVSVINGTTHLLEATIDIGERPRGIGISPDGSEVYVAISKENKIAVFDPESLKILRKFNAGEDPEAFAVHPNGNIYISNEDSAKATVINPENGKFIAEIPVGIEPEGVAISPDGTRVIITSESTNMLHVIAVPEHEIVSNILVGARPRAATFTNNGKFAYATAEIGGEVIKVDMATGKIVQHISLGDDKAKPKDILLSKDGKHLYVAGGRLNQVMVLDSDSLALIKGIPVGKRVWGLAMSKDGKRLYSSNGVSSDVSIIDTDSNTVVATTTVGIFPWGIVIDD
jgi:PQQ-dependent catabolism-associated beta-propeller protein